MKNESQPKKVVEKTQEKKEAQPTQNNKKSSKEKTLKEINKELNTLTPTKKSYTIPVIQIALLVAAIILFTISIVMTDNTTPVNDMTPPFDTNEYTQQYDCVYGIGTDCLAYSIVWKNNDPRWANVPYSQVE